MEADPAQRPWRAVAIAGVATAGAAALLAAWLAPLPSAEVWGGLTAGDCTEYCEASLRCGALATRAAIQQPANTWSNLAFYFVGVLALARGWTPGSVAFAFSCLLLGTGSLLFHATVTREFQWLDVAGMYVALAAVAARAVHDAFGVPWRWTLPAFSLVSAALVAFKWVLNTTLVMVALAGIAAAGMVRTLRRGHGRAMAALLPLGLIALGYGIRALDVGRVVCDPESLVQGHAIWHLLSAASLYAAWRFFDAAPRSGRPIRPGDSQTDASARTPSGGPASSAMPTR